MANYLILSLQADQIVPGPVKNETEIKMMEEKLISKMKKFNMSRLDLFRNISVQCEDFIVFLRDKSFTLETWPKLCGEIFHTTPILTPFGACFNSKLKIW